jgi:hypothetical protein
LSSWEAARWQVPKNVIRNIDVMNIVPFIKGQAITGFPGECAWLQRHLVILIDRPTL